MKELRSEIVIDAPPERVWETLTDFTAFPDWNPFIQQVQGEPREGAKLQVRIVPPGGRGMTFKPTVLEAVPSRSLRWLGRAGLPGLFDGEHSFTLEPIASGQTRLIQAERFNGLLVPLAGGTLAKTHRGFEAMNEALKHRVELQETKSAPTVASSEG
jgi:hypothetical protein